MKIYCEGILLFLCASWTYDTKAEATTEVETQTISSQNKDVELAEINTIKATTFEQEKEEPVATSNPVHAFISDSQHPLHVPIRKPPKHNPLNGSPSLSQLLSYYPILPQQSSLSPLPLPYLQSSYIPPIFYPIPVYLPYPVPFSQLESAVSSSKLNAPKRKVASQNVANASTQERHGSWHQKWDKQKLNDTDEYPVRQNIFKEWKGNWQNRTHLKEKYSQTTTTAEVPTIPTEPSINKLSTPEAETTTTSNEVPKKHFLIFDELKQKLNNRQEKFNENSTEETIDKNSSTTKGYEKHKIIEAWKEKWFNHPDKSETLTDINPQPTPSVRYAVETKNLANVQNDDTIIIKAV